MFDSVAKETFEMLPEEQQAEVVDFIMFLGEKTKVSEDEKGFPFDVLPGI